MQSIILSSLLALLLSACASTPPGPKQPDTSVWLPVNATVPAEIKR